MMMRRILLLVALAGVLAVALWVSLAPSAMDGFVQRVAIPSAEDRFDAWIEQLKDPSGTAQRIGIELETGDGFEGRDRLLARLEDHERAIDRRGAEGDVDAILELLAPAEPDRLRPIVELVVGPRYYDERTQRRIEAANMLTHLQYEPAIDPLIDVMRNPREHIELRRAAAAALDEMPHERAAAALDSFWYGLDDPPLAQLEGFSLSDEVLGRLLALSDENRREARDARERCQRRYSNETVLAYMAALGQSDERLRWAAARCLAAGRDARALTPLRRAARFDSSERVRSAAHDAVDTIELNVRLMGDRGLGGGDIAELEAALGDRHHVVREQAIKELAALEDPQSTDVLLTALEDPDPQLRVLALEALAKRRPYVDDALQAFVESEAEWKPLWRAYEALGWSETSRGAELLVAQLGRTEDPLSRGHLLSELARIDDPRALGPILLEVQSDDEGRRWFGMQALRILGSEDRGFAVDPLIEVLQRNRDPEVRKVVLEVLTRLTGRSFGMDIAAWIEWSDRAR